MKYKIIITLGLMLVAAALLLTACGAPEPTKPVPVLDVFNQDTQPVQPCPTVEPCAEAAGGPVEDVPYAEAWAASAHADAEAEAFVHWNEEDPAVVAVDCAKCHSTPGFIDFMGADGSAAGIVDTAPPVGTVVTCTACHNEGTEAMTSVVFPSGVEITGLGGEARCMQCHQGRASKVRVDEVVANLPDLDTPSEDASFINIHYYAAAATMYGTLVQGGYEYEGKSYDAKFDHVDGYDTCTGCHDPHSLAIKVDECQACHTGVNSVEDLAGIRMEGSLVDYDGDGDVKEGIAGEIETLQEMTMQAMQAYASEVAGMPIVYSTTAHPYFFIDTNGNGQPDEEEINSSNRFSAWTGRLMKAAYNYQVSLKDPGAFAHGGKYIIQLLYDSIEDLNSQISTPVDLSQANRIDNGHFAGSEEAFRHWDAENFRVPADCAKCHSATGLPLFLEEASHARDGVTGIVVGQPAGNGLECATCHNDVTSFSRFAVNEVKFPSGAVLSFGEAADSNLCLECHQGRESSVSVQRAISTAGVEDDAVSETLSFRNPHYFATGATLFGSEAKGPFQYEGKEYAGRFMHVEPMNTCTECHYTHELEVKLAACGGCHQGAITEEALADIRMGSTEDFDGDGDAAEGIAREIETMHERLYEAIQAYATDLGTPILYDSHRYPYFLADPNGNNQIDEGEGGFASWTPRLLKAAYNYQWVEKDPGAFAHNGTYIMQILYDSLEDLGMDVSGMTRPAVPAPETP